MVLDRVRYFRRLERQQWFSCARLSEFRFQKLQRLLTHAYENVPYYRRLLDDFGIRPKDIVADGDLQKIPVLTKEALQQNNPTEFLARGVDPKQCLTIKTSGSMGKPLQLLRSKYEDLFGNLTYPRALAANGLRPWHKQAIIIDSNRIPTGRKFFDKTRSPLKIFLWAGQNVQKQIEVLRSFRPHAIRGYSQSLKLLAHAINQAGIKDIRPRFIFGVAEVLDRPSRSLINQVFGVEMVDIYGSAEAYCIAWECPKHCGYHLNIDTLIVEFIRNGKPANIGEPGRIVVTPLHLYTMPLIRYDLGDIGVPTHTLCTCGRALPMMENIQGRADDFITLRSGALLAPVGTFANVIEKEQTVIEYLVVQETYDLISVRLVIRDGKKPGVPERVRVGIEELIRHEAYVKVEVVDQIDRAPGTKARRIFSRIPAKF